MLRKVAQRHPALTGQIFKLFGSLGEATKLAEGADSLKKQANPSLGQKVSVTREWG